MCRPFVGRRDELRYLRERRLEAGTSRGGFVLVAGDAGVGKSRLLAEFCRSLAYGRWKVATGSCVEFASRPYGPILEVLAKLGGAPFELGEASSKREQFDAIVERISAVAARSAVVVVVEDLHWADAATLDLLVYLSTKVDHARVLVLVSFRADELHPESPVARAVVRIARAADTGRIDLGPLRGVELQTFIDETLGDTPLSEDARRAVATAGEGNPFFTEELLKSAVELNATSLTSRKDRNLPTTVRANLIDRLRPFDGDERAVLTQAAMIGRTFGLDLLAATLEREPAQLLPVLRKARDFQLVEETGPSAFRFRHGLTRDAIYSDFLQAELRPRHRAIALTLESAPKEERSLEALAYHWWAAGEGTRAARYNELVGDAAAAIHAHEDAIAAYERALEFENDPLHRGAIVKRIADRRVASGSPKEAQAAYASAADLFERAGAFDRAASARAAAAITAYGIGLPEPTRPLETMLERLDAAEYSARSRVHLGLAWLLATFGFPTRATQHLAAVDARALAEAGDIAVRFHNVSAFVAMTLGDVDAFRREHAAWVATARSLASPQMLGVAYVNGAMCRAILGLHEEAQSDLEQVFLIAREAKSRHLEESAHAFSAFCSFMSGDLPGVRRSLEHVSPSSENRVNVTFAIAVGTLAGAALDDRALVERWFDGFEASVGPKPEPECGAGFAEIMIRRGRRHDAEDLLERALPDCELLRGNVATLLAIGRYGKLDTRARARAFLARAAEAPIETPERAALALFDALEAHRKGDAEEANRLAAEAADGFRRLRMPWFEAQAREAAGDHDLALALYRRTGAAYDVARLAAPAPQTSRALTSREREIASLAADGLSNLEIAGELSISHKTVEKHLGSIFEKLAIASRAQLGAHLKDGATSASPAGR